VQTQEKKKERKEEKEEKCIRRKERKREFTIYMDTKFVWLLHKFKVNLKIIV